MASPTILVRGEAEVVVADAEEVAEEAETGYQIGAGWRPELHNAIVARKDVAFVEILAESHQPNQLLQPLLSFAKDGKDIYIHGTELSLGSAALPDSNRLSHLADLAIALHSPLISEHFAFVRSDSTYGGHLLPLPRTKEMVKVFVENYRVAQAQLPVPLALENVASFLEWPENEMSEVAFLNEILEQTGAPFLLDVANLYANCLNNGFDALDAISNMDLNNVAYVHIAGGVIRNDGWYHDTHQHSIANQVWGLLKEVLLLKPELKVMIERDGNYDVALFNREMDKLNELGGAVLH